MLLVLAPDLRIATGEVKVMCWWTVHRDVSAVYSAVSAAFTHLPGWVRYLMYISVGNYLGT